MPAVKVKNLITWKNMEEDKILNLLAFFIKKKKENLNQTVSDRAEKIGVSIKDEDISIAHRLKASQNAKPEKPPNVIVCFTNQRIHNKIYQS